jgi:AcrR family transcriptional regulator
MLQKDNYITNNVYLYRNSNFIEMPSTPENKKLKDILQASRMLFWKHGFRRVTVEEICRVAGVSRMTFYRFYPNKIELAKAVIDRVIDDSTAEFRKILEADIPVPEKIARMIRLKFEGVHDISPEFLLDFYHQQDTGLAAFMEEKTKASWQEMMMDFNRAKEMGVFRKDIDLNFFFLISQKLIDLTRDESFLRFFPNPEEMIMELTRFMVYGISSHS